MRKHLNTLALAAFLMGGLSGCSYDIDKTGGSQGKLSGPGATLDFESVFQAVLRPKCATCHSAAQGNRAGVNLETYENVFANRAAVQSVVQGGFMPPRSAAGLTADEKAFLLAWLSAGAPRNAAAGGAGPGTTPDPGQRPPPTPPAPGDDCKRGDDDDDDDCIRREEPVTGPISFALVFERVFAPNCVSCHGQRGGVNLETYDNVFANRQAIVDAVDGGFMPPRSRSPLSPEQKELLMRWIQSGAPFSNP